jgi:hypothetical protein
MRPIDPTKFNRKSGSVLGYSQPSLRDSNDLLLRNRTRLRFFRASQPCCSLSANHRDLGPHAPAHDWGDKAQPIHELLKLFRK